jgi:methyltransferase-like protein/ubiquinone/menaquinone biosynthesis C-methylase UbiE
VSASPAPARGGAYDLFEYPGYAYSATHPARLEAIARLFGLRPKPAEQSRVLELGCGDGGNLLSLAQALPGARLVGIDAAASAVERGNRLARAAGLQNVELRCMDLEELPEAGDLGEAGSFDYILSHGVYSWIPPRVRVALLAGVRRYLAPMGVAYVSYNAYPGSYLRDMARDILGYHVREIEDPQRKLSAAQELMQTIVAIEEPSPYAQVLREHMERMLRYSTALLFHDDLAEISTPFYFHEFVEHASSHSLAFLAEADLFESQMRDVPESAGLLMSELPDDVVVREQYLDFFKNRMFRQTLVCHAQAPASRALDDREIERLWISSAARPQEGESDLGEGDGRAGGETDSGGDAMSRSEPAVQRMDGESEPPVQPVEETYVCPEGYSVTTSEPLVQAAMRALGEVWPRALDFPTLLERAFQAAGREAQRELVQARLRAVLLQAYLARIVILQGCAPPVADRAAARPLASPFARAQFAAGLPAISSLLHANVRLEGELEPRLLLLLDGTRDMEALTRELSIPAERVEVALRRFASIGLLAG